MARETKRRTVGGFEVLITKHPSRDSAKLLAKILRAITPAFAALKDIDLGKLVGALTAEQAAQVRPPIEVTGGEPSPAEPDKREILSLFDLDILAIAPAIEALFGALSDAAIDGLLLSLLQHTTVIAPGYAGDMKRHELRSLDAIDEAFDDRMPLMFQVCAAAVEHNFGGFFSDSGPLAAFVRAMAARSATSSSPQSSGASGTPSGSSPPG